MAGRVLTKSEALAKARLAATPLKSKGPTKGMDCWELAAYRRALAAQREEALTIDNAS